MEDSAEYDVVIVGTGPAGATLAKELALTGLSVLVLEQGAKPPAREGFLPLAAVARRTPVGENMATNSAAALGGTSNLYLGVAEAPKLEAFADLGVDLRAAYEAARNTLPIAVPSGGVVGPQGWLLAQAARAVGLQWSKHEMLVDERLCDDGQYFAGRWKAWSAVNDAVRAGASVLTRAKAVRVRIEGGEAVGVDYQRKKGGEILTARSRRVVLCAGSVNTPGLLLASHVLDGAAGTRFYSTPSFVMFGQVNDLKAGAHLTGVMGVDIDETLSLGDSNASPVLHRMIMLLSKQWRRVFDHRRTLSIGVQTRDLTTGKFTSDGTFFKEISAQEREALERGERIGRDVLEQAGASRIGKTRIASAHVGGLVRIGAEIDNTFETDCRHLYVCDGSVIPHNARVAPTVTLVTLANYLANHLVKSLDARSPQARRVEAAAVQA